MLFYQSKKKGLMERRTEIRYFLNIVRADIKIIFLINNTTITRKKSTNNSVTIFSYVSLNEQ